MNLIRKMTSINIITKHCRKWSAIGASCSEAYFYDSAIMIREKVVLHRGDIANRGDTKRIVTYLCITFISTWYKPTPKILRALGRMLQTAAMTIYVQKERYTRVTSKENHAFIIITTSSHTISLLFWLQTLVPRGHRFKRSHRLQVSILSADLFCLDANLSDIQNNDHHALSLSQSPEGSP